MDAESLKALKKMNFDEDTINFFKDQKVDYNSLLLFNEFPDLIPNGFLLGDQLKLRRGVKALAQEQAQELKSLGFKTISISNSSGSSSVNQDSTDTVLLDDVISVVSVEYQEETDNISSPPKRMRTETIDNVDKPILEADRTPKPSKYILDILNESAAGKVIISTHEQRGLNNGARCKLADIIVTHEFKGDTNTVIHGNRFSTLAKWIVECFPGEFAETYYISSCARGKGRAASGKLYDFYSNQNKELRKLGLRTINAGPLQQLITQTGLSASFPPNSSAGDVEVQKALDFLASHVGPWELVKSSWEITCSARLHALRDPQNQEFKLTSDYVTKYQALLQPGGHTLLEHDFQVLFADAADRFITHWPQFVNKLKAEFIKSRITNLETDSELLYNFPRLFSVVPVKIPGNKPWRATRAEVQEGFLIHLKVIGDIEKQLNGMKKTVQARGVHLQPFACIVGEDLKHITSSYVVIDERPIKVESPRRAVEVTFKAFHALYSKYPVQSERVWIVLQKAIFGINEEIESSVKTTPEVLRLVSALKCIDS